MTRKLASVQYVHDIYPIEGADHVEAIGVLGWKCVAKKGEFKVGDWCVYFEIDSFLPIDDRFEFLRASSFKNSDLLGEGFRLKTQRFREPGSLSAAHFVRIRTVSHRRSGRLPPFPRSPLPPALHTGRPPRWPWSRLRSRRSGNYGDPSDRNRSTCCCTAAASAVYR